MRIVKNSLIKGIFSALLLILVLQPKLKVEAATADDLRELIGDRRITDDTLLQDVRSIIYEYQKTKYKKELIDLLHEMGDFGYEETFTSLINAKKSELLALETSFKANANVNIIITQMNEVICILKELGALKQENTYILEGLLEHEDEEAYQYAISAMEALNDTFDLGQIGEGLKPPTKDQFTILKPYGEIIYPERDNEIEISKGIYLYAKRNIGEELKFEIISQFNGVVSDILKTQENQYSILIQSGKSIVSRYDNITDIKVKRGEEVRQYDLLGYAVNESIYFEILLNTLPINPLFLYGKAGFYAYDTWYASNPGMALSKVDFSNVKNTINVSKLVESIIESIVEIDDLEKSVHIIKDEGYEKPETPVIGILEFDN